MWRWINTGAGAVGLQDGVVRHGEQTAFLETAGLAAALRVQLLETRKEATLQAQAIIAEARGQAAQLLDEAREQARACGEDAHVQGLQRGLTDAATRWHQRRWDAVLERAASLQSGEEALARLVEVAVGRIVRSTSTSALFERALEQVRALTQGLTSARLRVAPVDRDAAAQAVESTRLLRDTRAEIEIVCDDALAPGSCVFESDLGTLDAGLGIQLAALRAVIDAAIQRESLPGREQANPGETTLQEAW